MVAFYNQGDQAIYSGGQHFIPQEKYRLGYTAPTTEEKQVTQSFGIPYTNAFTGGGGGGTGGNVFGYGSQIEPGGSFGSYGTPNYTGGLRGNVQQYGVGRQFEDASASPIGETYSYKKEVPGWLRTVGSVFPGGNYGLDFLEKRMNLNRDQPPGTYKIGGLDTGMKGLYDNLAGEQMLFEGPGGIKTLTGKNFAGPGYLEGQMELAKGFNFDTMTDQEIQDAIEEEGQRHLGLGHTGKGFKYNQMREAWNVYKTNKVQTADAIKEYDKKQARKKAIAEGQKYSASLDVAPQHHRDISRGPGGAGDQGHQAQNIRDIKDEGPGVTASSGMHGGKHYAQGGRARFFYGGLARLL